MSRESLAGADVRTQRRVAASNRAELNRKNPALGNQLDQAGRRAAYMNEKALRTGINASLAVTGVGVGISGGYGYGYWNNDFSSPHYNGYYNNHHAYSSWSIGFAFNACYPWSGIGNCYWNNYCYPYGYGYNCYGLYPYYYSSLYCGFYGGFWGGGFGGGYGYYDDTGYEDGYDEGYDRGFDRGVAYYDDQIQEGEGVLVSGEVSAGQRGTRVVPSTSQANQEALGRAAAHYLTVGDQAFQDGRYGDAVHFYAKAVEFAPDEGVLYLILSDALFATGDYHYAAYALRKALELDPTVTEMIADKHTFYTDPAEFDRQLAVLETFLQDHYVDDDARLLLAANYLFGNRPAAAVDLLESPFSKNVLESPSGQLLLTAAKSIQYGTPAED